MTTTKVYDDLVEGFRAKISGNISSVKMTPSETAKEIADIQDGAVSVFEREEGNKGPTELTGTSTGGTVNYSISTDGQTVISQHKRMGRPPGSKNRPKEPK